VRSPYPAPVSSTPPFRALVLAAHPDDIEFGCAGTVAGWVREGAAVTYCIATDGSTGTQDRALMGERLGEIRRAESEAAAAVVGVSNIEWLGYRDGYVEYTLHLRRDIARLFRRLRPHRFVVMDPTPVIGTGFVNHPDHRAVGQASLDVSLTAGTTPGHFPELLDEGLEPWRGLREVWIAGPAGGPRVNDISDVIELKIDALMCHATQVGEDRDALAARIREWAADLGEQHGMAFAESFVVISQGPGFHPDEQGEGEAEDLATAPFDPRSARRSPEGGGRRREQAPRRRG
jgi:LmbE family N-acetylglucosaminyl deacetylase